MIVMMGPLLGVTVRYVDPRQARNHADVIRGGDSAPRSALNTTPCVALVHATLDIVVNVSHLGVTRGLWTACGRDVDRASATPSNPTIVAESQLWNQEARPHPPMWKVGPDTCTAGTKCAPKLGVSRPPCNDLHLPQEWPQVSTAQPQVGGAQWDHATNQGAST